MQLSKEGPHERDSGHVKCSPRLRLIAVENLVCSEKIQLAMPLLKHVDSWKPAGGCDEGLFHTSWIHHFTLLYCATNTHNKCLQHYTERALEEEMLLT